MSSLWSKLTHVLRNDGPFAPEATPAPAPAPPPMPVLTPVPMPMTVPTPGPGPARVPSFPPPPGSAPIPPNPSELLTALSTLEAFFQDRVVPRMIAELRSPSVDVRRSAISVLRHAGMAGVHAIPALLEVVERPADTKDICAEYARKEAAYAIEELRRVYQSHLEEEQQRLQEADAALRREEEAQRREEESAARAAMAETPLPPASAPLPPVELDDNLAALLQLMVDPVAGVRASVIQALVKLDAAHPKVLSALRAALRDEDSRVRQEAALAIGQLVR
jgi:HEAT repeat protein